MKARSLARLAWLGWLTLPAMQPRPALARMPPSQRGRARCTPAVALYNLPARLLRRVPAVLLALLCLLQLAALLRAPALVAPEQIAITLAPGAAITVGQAELAAPQAARQHLALRRDGDGRWWVANASADHQLLLQRAGRDGSSGAAVLQAGQAFAVGGARFAVGAAGAQGLTLTGPGGRWTYDGVRLLRDGRPQAPCADSGAGARLALWWNIHAPAALALARPLAFGGNLYCGNRIGIAGVDSHAALIVRGADGLELRARAGAQWQAPLTLSPSASSAPLLLASREHALDGVGALVAGHTRLALRPGGDTLYLRPGGHVAWMAGAASVGSAAALPPGVRWQLRARDAWSVPTAGASLFVVVVLGAVAAVSATAVATALAMTGRPRALAARGLAGVSASALLVAGGLAALLLQRAGTPAGAGWSLLLAGAALWRLLLADADRPRLATGAAVLLLAAGLLSQLDMGLAGADSAWLRHYQKSAAVLALGLGGVTLLGPRWQGPRAARIATGMAAGGAALELGFALLAGVALAALAAQVVAGDETGVFDLQPVELAKLALTVLTAHCLAVGMGQQMAVRPGEPGTGMPVGGLRRRAPPWALAWAPAWSPALLVRCCRIGAPALLFASLLALALLEVDDYSPLILLLVWSTAMALAWALAARGRLAVAGIAALAVGGLATIAWLRLAGAAEVAGWSFYADRFLVWLDPASHPHTGQQLLLGARAIAEGGWWGSDGMLGLRSLGQDAAAALRIPQVQDDFAPAFFIHRHGLVAALAVWLVQAAFLAGLLRTALRAHAHAARARHFRQAWLGRFCCFALCGGAAFVLGHLLLSWGTNLAILPIMGQPMSFLSAGGSHLLFFICPLLGFTVLSAQLFDQPPEEKPSCQSMSNTK